MFDGNKIFNNELTNSDTDNISIFAVHVYASILNESLLNNSNQTNGTNSIAQQNENLLRAITPQIVEFLIEFFNEQNEIITMSQERKALFYNKKLIFCRCLPLIVNVLHSSLPDKRLVDLSFVLDKFMDAFQKCNQNDIKLEFVKSYLNMLYECTDRAALKIVIVSKRFFISLLEQLSIVTASCKQDKIANFVNDYSGPFLHEFVRLVLCLIKSLVENSESVKVNIIF